MTGPETSPRTRLSSHSPNKIPTETPAAFTRTYPMIQASPDRIVFGLSAIPWESANVPARVVPMASVSPTLARTSNAIASPVVMRRNRIPERRRLVRQGRRRASCRPRRAWEGPSAIGRRIGRRQNQSPSWRADVRDRGGGETRRPKKTKRESGPPNSPA
jgi:hypothetical protein